MAGRKTLYTPEIAKTIVGRLRDGCIIEDVCASVGISHTAYFDWVKRYPEFAESVKRAKAEANVGAALSLRKAMMPHDVTSETTKTITETRLRKGRNEYGVIDEPYTYTKTERSHTLSNEFDWRAALEFLKRRDPDNWSEKLIIRVEPEHLDLINKLGFKSPSDAFQALLDNARRALADANADS